MSLSRRRFMQSLSAAAALAGMPRWARASAVQSPFHVAVINDEITEDFGRACEIAAGELCISHDLADHAQGRGAEACVRVEKQQNVTRRGLGGGIHLNRSSGFGMDDSSMA